MISNPIRSPRGLAFLCALGAALLGLAYMAAGGAPPRYLAVNAAAFALGSLIVAAMRGKQLSPKGSGLVSIAVAAILLGVSLAGVSAEGVHRWVRAGPVLLQPSLILVPTLLLGFARSRSRVAALAVAVAALALALAPDRAMAAAMAAGLAPIALFRRGRLELVILATALVALAIALYRPDPLPAAPFVERVLWDAFAVHPAAGLAVWAAVLLLPLPAFAGLRDGRADRLPHAVFGASWLAVIAAAALGNYPTPLVGYGSSAILGYLLSITGLPPHRTNATPSR
jgi:hypothetical protein